MTLDDYVQAIGLPSGGAVRASLGIPTNSADIKRFAEFAAEFVDLADVPGNRREPAARRRRRGSPRSERPRHRPLDGTG
jgi:hypothetical protein